MTITREKQKKILSMLLAVIIFKIASDYGYWKITSLDTEKYLFRFNAWKYAFSSILLMVEFFGIRHFQRKASSIMLLVFYLLQMIPLTTIYALGDDSTSYYFAISLGFILCEIMLWNSFTVPQIVRERWASWMMAVAFFGLVLFIIIYLFCNNGLPGMDALDIYSVYDLRSSGSLKIGKYQRYILTWIMGAVIPLYIVIMLQKRKYLLSLPGVVIMLLVYLYTGFKTYLFAIPLILISTLWARRKNFGSEMTIAFCLSFSILVFLALFSPIKKTFFVNVYSLLGRRMMLVPANNKFKYFDFFSSHPKMGLYGIFPSWLLQTESPYENIKYTYLISKIYYNRPEMNSNTGFLAEGYMRFGYYGIPVLFFILALLFKGIDRFQERNGYEIAVGLFIYPIFSLADGQLLSSMVSGEWLILIGILLFYKRLNIYKENPICLKR